MIVYTQIQVCVLLTGYQEDSVSTLDNHLLLIILKILKMKCTDLPDPF